jgi:hypothetical protein
VHSRPFVFLLNLHPLPLLLPFFLAGKDGAVTRVTDEATGAAALEVTGPSCSATWIACPPDKAGALSIRLPVLDLVLKQPVAQAPHSSPSSPSPSPPRRADTSIEVTVRDGAGGLRRLRASTFQAAPRVTPALAALPLRLDDGGPGSGGWVRVRLDLPSLLARAYPGSPPFAEVVRLRVHAAARLRCVYFAERAMAEAELPAEFRLFVRSGGGGGGGVSGDGRQQPADAGQAVAVA